jgi:hypothetical protein
MWRIFLTTACTEKTWSAGDLWIWRISSLVSKGKRLSFVRAIVRLLTRRTSGNFGPSWADSCSQF